MAGLLNKETSSPLPLRASSVWTDLRGFTARTTATLTYYNDHRFEIEAIFVLPLSFSSHVVEFEANIEGRYLFVDIENEIGSEKKAPIYDLESRSDDIFAISIGKLSPWILIDVQMTIVSEVLWMPCKSGLSFTLPSIFTPRIVSDAARRDEISTRDGSKLQGANSTAVSTLGYSLQVNIDVEAPCLLAGVSSDTYPIVIETLPEEDSSSRLRVQLSEDFKHVDNDFHLNLYLAKPREPFIYIEPARHTHTNEVAEKNPISNIMNNPVLMLSYSPDLACLSKDDAGCISELIFMIDRSGSMNGNSINNAKETILLFLHSLPPNAYFNVISFGTYFQSLFKESQPYSNANLEEACHYVRKIRADMGGTSLLEPLDWVFNKPLRKAVPRQIFMVTDGVITDAAKVMDCVRKNSHLSRYDNSDCRLIPGLFRYPFFLSLHLPLLLSFFSYFSTHKFLWVHTEPGKPGK